MKSLYAIIKPVITEKATSLETKNKYVFWVNRKATKVDVKNSIREMYGMEVLDVKMMTVTAKHRQVGRRVLTKRPAMKKAIITLKGGKKLDLSRIGKEPKEVKEAKEVKAPKETAKASRVAKK